MLVLVDAQRGVLTDSEGQVGENYLAGLWVIEIHYGHLHTVGKGGQECRLAN